MWSVAVLGDETKQSRACFCVLELYRVETYPNQYGTFALRCIFSLYFVVGRHKHTLESAKVRAHWRNYFWHILGYVAWIGGGEEGVPTRLNTYTSMNNIFHVGWCIIMKGRPWKLTMSLKNIQFGIPLGLAPRTQNVKQHQKVKKKIPWLFSH